MKEYIITNATIKQNNFGGYFVVADSERFGEQEILFESPFVEECVQYIEEHTEEVEETATQKDVVELTYKLRVWFKGTKELAWTEIFRTRKCERDLYEMLEAQVVNTEMYDYILDDYPKQSADRCVNVY